jgi:hypothetical protein
MAIAEIGGGGGPHPHPHPHPHPRPNPNPNPRLSFQLHGPAHLNVPVRFTPVVWK